MIVYIILEANLEYQWNVGLIGIELHGIGNGLF